MSAASVSVLCVVCSSGDSRGVSIPFGGQRNKPGELDAQGKAKDEQFFLMSLKI